MDPVILEQPPRLQQIQAHYVQPLKKHCFPGTTVDVYIWVNIANI